MSAGAAHRQGRWDATTMLVVALLGLFALPRAAGASEDVWRFSGSGGGYVRALEIDAAGVFWAGTENGGVFESRDGGVSWGAVNAGITTGVAVRALALDTELSGTLYAATRGAGVFKTTNSGGQWTAINTGLESVEVNALAIDPRSRTFCTPGRRMREFL